MSYPAAIDSLVGRVCALVPEWEPDRPFYTFEDGAGGALVDVETAPDDVVRLFDIRLAGLPEDDNASGYGLSRFRVSCELRVRYPAAADRARTERMIATDVAQLVHGLVHPGLPAPWHPSIVTVEPPTGARLGAVTGPEGQLVAHLIRLPFVILYTVDLEA